jgi:hypothetical protein
MANPESQKDFKANSLVIPEVEEAMKGWCQELAKLEEGDIIRRADCKFCNHRLRQDAEQKWEETHNFNLVQRFFAQNWQEGDPPKMNYANLRNHLMGHYERQVHKVQIREYSERLQSMLNYKITKDQQLEALSTSLQMKYVEIASNSEHDELRAADMQIKIAKMLLDIIAMQARLRGELNSVNVVVEKFVNSWVHLITSEKDPERRGQLTEYLQQFREELSGLENEQ